MNLQASESPKSTNPFLEISYEPAIEALGDDYFDIVAAAEFPRHILRFRNDALLPTLGLEASQVTDADFVNAFGKFQDRQPLLALRYHGYQFGEYNPFLGDGRGFLYGQIRGVDGDLYDLGTKGSGNTPYSRGGDGRLTLKGGVREVLASEMLQVLGVRTSRCLSLVETGEALWRGDEPSPTRSSVMIRLSRSHIRFGTFERLRHIGRLDLVPPLLNHVIECYYPHLVEQPDRYSRFYAELIQRTADLVAQWMASGFCHAVLNTDNMSITGESFDYGPYAFIDRYNPHFTAAYFDHFGRYSYGNQSSICYWNLEMLQAPLKMLIPGRDFEAGLAEFDDRYRTAYRQRMLLKLGFTHLPEPIAAELLKCTIDLLHDSEIGYHEFFKRLRQLFSPLWRQDKALIFNAAIAPESETDQDPVPELRIVPERLQSWQKTYHQALTNLPASDLTSVATRLCQHNPTVALLRPVIEAVWEPIAVEDNWLPFNELLQKIRESVVP